VTTQPPTDPATTNQTNIQVNIDYLRTTRVHICMPCYGGQLTEQCFMSYIKWANLCRQLGIDWTVETMTNESLISRARNTLTAKFLHTKESTHLMFIDADIGWEPWHLLVMLDAQKDVIGGLYPRKSLPVKWCVNGIPGLAEDPNSNLVEVTKTGTGFLLIKRDVFEKLDAHPATKPFNNDIGLPVELNPYMKTYFDTAVRENRYYSEDWTFCENWRDIGGQVWVDKRVLLRHVGTYTFDYATHEQLYKDLKQMFEPGTVNVTPVSQTEALPNNAVPAGHELAKEPVPEPEPTVMASSKKSKKVAAEQLNVKPEATVIASHINDE
jgi:hypothetical protein